MGQFKTKILLSFRTKVIVPVILVMLLALTTSMWLVNRRVAAQSQTDARKQLRVWNDLFQHMLAARQKELRLRFGNVANEPRIKAAAAVAASDGLPASSPDSAGVKTLQKFIADLLAEKVADVVLIQPLNGPAVVEAQDPQFKTGEFETNCAAFINLARKGTEKVGLQHFGGKLYDLVALPIQAIATDETIGTITFAVENSLAEELQNATRSQLVELVVMLPGSQRIISSTSMSPKRQQQVITETPRLFCDNDTADEPAYIIKDLLLDGDEHFLGLFGPLPGNEAGGKLTYAVLYSKEEWQRALSATQRVIFSISLAATALVTLLVWFFVHKVTKPLQQLRAGVEALGTGNFSRQVAVRSRDEFGELSQAFNRMTENLQATQAKLIQSEKLSAVGEFVAGVAHELNNPLTTVMGFSELLKQDALSVKHGEFVDMIHKNAQRCQRIVLALLSFARRHQPERQPVSVNQIIEATQDILGYQMRTNNIKVTCQLAPQLPLVMGDSHQLQQVFVNILNNARQAIAAHQPEGWINLTTATAGPNVRITIQDSGPGITAENLTKLFDPFFTTKGVGEGTGLGLSLCYGIIKEHGGNITPSSRPGEGATFLIELPATHETRPANPPPAVPEPNAPPEGTGKRVLVIDDEPTILAMISEALGRLGYTVETVTDGALGLKLLRQSDYDIVLCDWKMPGLNGRQVYDRLRVFKPALTERMIFITGDLVSEPTRKFLEAEKKICLPKPFTLAEFCAAIKQVLPR